MSDQAKKALGMIHVTQVKKAKVSKEDKAVLKANSLESEDAFEEMYIGDQDKKIVAIRPPFDPNTLMTLCQMNNTLGQLVSAMEVNVDGTGYVIEDSSGEAVEDGDEAKAFFDEVFPGVSLISLRRELRRDLEATGNGYLEVIRSLEGKIVFLKHVPAATIRMLHYDSAVPAEKSVFRNGKEFKVTMSVRERRYVQVLGRVKVFFKEYKASRDLDSKTGLWAKAGAVVTPENKASELLHFIVDKDAKTPYGVPRWINQVPSVLGSRKAEELNLDFFNAGGLPPAMIIIQGGAMAAEVRKDLQSYLSGKGSSKNRAAIIEVFSTSGDISGGGNVKVTVERFGSERQQDSMFENYDEKCERRVRASFRLPPMFVGRTEDFNFATAKVSYMVAEAQVFAPERFEFDERLNVTIMRELDPTKRFRSLPLVIKDVEVQLKGVEMAAAKGAITKGALIDAINEVADLNLPVVEGGEDETAGGAPVALDENGNPIQRNPFGRDLEGGKPGEGGPNDGEEPTMKEKSDTIELIELANDFTAHVTGDREFTRDQVRAMVAKVDRLSTGDRARFDGYVTMRAFGAAVDHDLHGAVELCGCAAEVMAKDDCQK